MRTDALVLTLAAITACGTETPNAPSTNPNFTFVVTPSSSCRTAPPPDSSIPLPQFELLLVGQLILVGPSTFRAAPPSDPNCNPSDLHIELTGDGSRISGTIAGMECFLTPAIWNATFTPRGAPPGRLEGTLQQLPNGPAVTNGVLDGTINVGLKFSSVGGECRASDHHWELRPR
jgi:hypothetical protein